MESMSRLVLCLALGQPFFTHSQVLVSLISLCFGLTTGIGKLIFPFENLRQQEEAGDTLFYCSEGMLIYKDLTSFYEL